MFKVGDTVFYKGQGVGVIKDKIDKIVSGDVISVFKVNLKYLGNFKQDLFIPVKVADSRLRKIATKKKANEIVRLLKEEKKIEPKVWASRMKHLKNDIVTGEIDKIVDVFSTMKSIKKNKDLSFSEIKIYDHTLSLLSGELAESLSLDVDKVKQKLEG